MEHDWDVAGGAPMFPMFDPSIHVAPNAYELDFAASEGVELIATQRDGREFRYPVTLGLGIDHGSSHPCGTLWVARDRDGDIYAYRDRSIAGLTAGQNAIEIRSMMSDLEYQKIPKRYQVIDANAPLADRQETQISDLYRYSDGRRSGTPILPHVDHCKKPPGSVNRGAQEIGQMLMATLAAVAPHHRHFKGPTKGYPDGLPREIIDEYAQGRMLLISSTCTAFIKELKAARWDERNDPTLNAPEKEVDRDNHVWKCLNYLLAEGFGGR
jgi:hypothetical protein